MTEETEKLPFTQHLEELRGTLLRSLIGLIIGVVAAAFFVNPILEFLTRPISGLQNLHAIEITETMAVYMRVALLGGFILALPWIVLQFLLFVGKGLKDKERKNIYLALPFISIMFLAGTAFAYYVMLPTSLDFFKNILAVTTSIRIKSYISFVTNLLFWIGVSFLIPLVFFILARIGLVNAKMLLKGWRIAIVAIAVMAAVITPTGDPINMLIFMLPLFVLYLLSILLSALARKPSKTEVEKEI